MQVAVIWVVLVVFTPLSVTGRLALCPAVTFNVVLWAVMVKPPAVVVLALPSIANWKAVDVPPLATGFNTVTSAVPTEATSAALIAAVNCVELTTVVLRAEPFHCTVDPETKFTPVTVSVKSGEPAVVSIGLKLAMTGVTVDTTLLPTVLTIAGAEVALA
jgi:hypothetical protein